MTGTSEVEIILLFPTIPHDAHNCCVACFQGSPPLMRRMAFRKVRSSDVHTSFRRQKKKKIRALSRLM